MNIYLVCIRGDYLDNQVVVCDKVEDIIELAFDSNREILLERLKANGIKEVSDYVKSNIKEIYFNLNFRINVDQQYLHYSLEYQEEIKKI